MSFVDKINFLLFIVTLTLGDEAQISIEQCKLCKKSARLADNIAGIRRHASEVLITTNCDIQTKEQILKSKGCRGTIYSRSNIVTTATCFDNQNISSLYCVYGSFLNLNPNTNFQKCFSDTITLHPNFNATSGEYDISVIKVKESINFDETITWMKLPDEPIDTMKFQDNNCYIVGHGYDTQNLQTFSAKVELICYDECLDLARIHSAYVFINPSQYCVLTRNLSHLDNFHTVGKGVICKNVVAGILTSNSLTLTEDVMTPIVDVGIHSTWLRSKMLNLKPVMRSVAISIRSCRNHLFSLILLFLFIFC